MTVTGKIRLKAALYLSSVDGTENFLWDKWLREAVTESKKISELYSELLNTDNIILTFENPGINEFTFRMEKVKTYKSSIRHLSIKSKTNRIFFGMGTTSSYMVPFKITTELKRIFSAEDEYQKGSILYNIDDDKLNEIDKQLIPLLQNYSGVLDKNYWTGKYKDKAFTKSYFTEYKTKTGKIEFGINIPENSLMNFSLSEPEVEDHLAKLIPKIYNVELLTIIEGNYLQGKYFQTKIDLLDLPPKIYKAKVVELPGQITTLEVPGLSDLHLQFYSTNYFSPLADEAVKEKEIKINRLDFKVSKNKLNQFKQFTTSLRIKPPALVDSGIDITDKLLQPEINLSEEEENDLLKDLYPFQKEGAKFLAENKNAILSDEMGLGKTVQAVLAVKYLFIRREIKSVLVLTNDNILEDKVTGRTFDSNDNWAGTFNKFVPDTTTYKINRDTENLTKDLNKPVQVHIFSFPQLLNSLTENLLNLSKIKNFDLVILDDAEAAVNKKESFKKFLKIKSPKYFWTLTNETHSDEVANIFPDSKPPEFLGRNKTEVQTVLPYFIRQDIWIDLDASQKPEYNQLYFLAQSQIFDALQTGNPFRVQAKVFSLLHQLKQVTNFASTKPVSNKTKMLLFQLSAIKKNNNQVIVFSQYDKFGTQKLTDLFYREKIKFTGFSSGMTLDEMENAIKKFSTDKSITVFLAGTQQAVKYSHLPYAPYIIYFDQWWIPVSNWQLEEKIISENSNKPAINIYNYLSKETIEVNLVQKLSEKNLLDKNITGTLGADPFSKLITESEWLDIFNLQHDENPNVRTADESYQKVYSLEPNKIVEKVKLLFGSLGYQNVNAKEIETNRSYILEGRLIKKGAATDFTAQVITSNNGINTNSIESFVDSAHNTGNNGKLFVVTLNPNYTDNKFSGDKVTIINGKSLGNFLSMFQLI